MKLCEHGGFLHAELVTVMCLFSYNSIGTMVAIASIVLTLVVWRYICNVFRCAHDHISSPQLYSQPLTIVSEYTI